MLKKSKNFLNELTTSANNTCIAIGRVLLSVPTLNKPKNLPSFSLPIV